MLADVLTGNLDSRTADAVLELFAELRRAHGLTLMVVTHSEEVAGRAQGVVRLRDGHLVEDRMRQETRA